MLSKHLPYDRTKVSKAGMFLHRWAAWREFARNVTVERKCPSNAYSALLHCGGAGDRVNATSNVTLLGNWRSNACSVAVNRGKSPVAAAAISGVRILCLTRRLGVLRIDVMPLGMASSSWWRSSIVPSSMQVSSSLDASASFTLNWRSILRLGTCGQGETKGHDIQRERAREIQTGLCETQRVLFLESRERVEGCVPLTKGT